MWMYTLFPKILNISLTANIIIIFVLLARLLLKPAPKIISCFLWLVVLFRLICPVSISASFSLLNIINLPVTEGGSIEYVPPDIVHTEFPTVDLPISSISEIINGSLPQGNEQLAADPLEAPFAIVTIIWICGIAIMVIGSIIATFKLRLKLIGASLLKDNIYLADHIASPFVMGLIFPKIYLPSSLSEKERPYIVEHEKTHIRRLDHIVKCIAYIALVIHWFNPLVWVAYIFLEKDMELSCDEAVMRKTDIDIRGDYSTSLLSLATGRKIINSTPLAFGEGNIKNRIKNIMNYKKPRVISIIIASVVVVVFSVILFTNPLKSDGKIMGANYQIKEIIYDSQDISSENTIYYSITGNYDLYTLEDESGKAFRSETWKYVGTMVPYHLTNKELDRYTSYKSGWVSKYRIKEVTDAYILRLEDNNFYIAAKTKNGDILLGYGWEDVSERNQGASDDTNIQWLVKLESTFTKGHINTNFFDRSLRNIVGTSVDCFSYHENNEIPGFLIVGFRSDGIEELSNMGFAVFQSKNDGYKLIDYNLYEDAAISNNKIQYINNQNYDVILSNNENLSTISSSVDGENEIIKTVDSNPDMTLFNFRKDEGGKKSVSYHFYDKNGDEIFID